MPKYRTTEEFILMATNKYGTTYDYSKVKYTNAYTKVCIVCKKHGEFWQTPALHLYYGGCTKCGRIRTTPELILEFKHIHGNKYDYSRVQYTTSKAKVCIVCPTHGEFWQSKDNHLKGKGCPTCNNIDKLSRYSMTIEDFTRRAIETHHNKYDYSKTKYINTKTPIIIICPKHGQFSQRPGEHLQGHGCPICNSSKGEKKVLQWLTTRGIECNPQYVFPACKDINPLSFDFFIPSRNLLIEFDGIQHYMPIAVFGGAAGHAKQKQHDRIKDAFCVENNITLLRIPYTKLGEIDNILSSALIIEDKYNEI